MCNLYSMTKNVDAIRRLFGALNSHVGNLPSLPGIFPDHSAPIVRNASDGREIVMARWGMPSSPFTLMQSAKLKAKGTQVSVKEILRLEPDCGVTNIRNTSAGAVRQIRLPPAAPPANAWASGHNYSFYFGNLAKN